MQIDLDLKCIRCREEIILHETGSNQFDVYPCEKCFPDEYDEIDEH